MDQIYNKESVAAEADRLVSGDRNESYGAAIDDFSRTALIWSAILKTKVTAEQVGMCMIGIKLSRECNKPKRDNAVDICGYAKCLDLVNQNKQERLAAGWTFDELTGVWKKPSSEIESKKFFNLKETQSTPLPNNGVVGSPLPCTLPHYPVMGRSPYPYKDFGIPDMPGPNSSEIKHD